MNRIKTSMLTFVLGTVLTTLFMTAQVAQALQPQHAAWCVVSSPNAGQSSSLYGVAAVSQKDVWAVGYYINGSTLQTLIEQWNGTSWNVVPSPNIGSGTNALYGVTVISANDIWAVGNYVNSSSIDQTLTEHWNGSSWSVVSSPNIGSNNNILRNVAAVPGSKQVWAVGEYSNNSVYQTLIEQWNGSSWKVVASPNAAGNNFLTGVAAVSASDVWAVGQSFNIGNPTLTLVEQWNGSSWSIVPSPNIPGSFTNILDGVAVVSANNIWAVGTAFNSLGTAMNTLIEQWNGSSWNIVPSPNPKGSTNSVLNAVAVVDANDVWAVGNAFISNNNTTLTLTEHWKGTTWKIAPSPNPSTSFNQLYGVTSIPGIRPVWTVGFYSPAVKVLNTLTMFRCKV